MNVTDDVLVDLRDSTAALAEVVDGPASLLMIVDLVDEVLRLRTTVAAFVAQEPDPDLRRRFVEWEKNRGDLSLQEEVGPFPAPGRWEASDDDAVELLRALAATLGWSDSEPAPTAVLPFLDDMGTEFTPWTNGVASGLRATRNGQTTFVYLNPSSSDEGADHPTPTVFLYSGPNGDPAQDGASVHVEILEEL